MCQVLRQCWGECLLFATLKVQPSDSTLGRTKLGDVDPVQGARAFRLQANPLPRLARSIKNVHSTSDCLCDENDAYSSSRARTPISPHVAILIILHLSQAWLKKRSERGLRVSGSAGYGPQRKLTDVTWQDALGSLVDPPRRSSNEVFGKLQKSSFRVYVFAGCLFLEGNHANVATQHGYLPSKANDAKVPISGHANSGHQGAGAFSSWDNTRRAHRARCGE